MASLTPEMLQDERRVHGYDYRGLPFLEETCAECGRPCNVVEDMQPKVCSECRTAKRLAS